MPFRDSLTPVPLRGTSLFDVLEVGSITLDHRVVLAPLTRFRSDKGVPNKLMKEYYVQRSIKKGTLLISEGTFISRAAGGYDRAPGVYTNEQVDKWRPIFKSIHGNKSFVFVQLWALGRQSFPTVLARDGLKYVSTSADFYMDEESKQAAIGSSRFDQG